jgi:hypothetical protein
MITLAATGALMGCSCLAWNWLHLPAFDARFAYRIPPHTRLRSYAPQLLRSANWFPRPGCGVIESTTVVTVDFK